MLRADSERRKHLVLSVYIHIKDTQVRGRLLLEHHIVFA